MTQQYWQRYSQQISMDPMHIDDPFWKHVKADLSRHNTPKHHMQLYSMCKSDNPYIRQIKYSPNITINTVAQLICRQKACELQYCLSLQKVAAENRRRKIQLDGCSRQYDTMTYCIQQQKRRINQKQSELRSKVLGLPIQSKPKTKQINNQPKSKIQMQFM